MEQQIDSLQQKIEELTDLVEENQRMVKFMYRRVQLATYFAAVKWIALIVITLGSLYFIQPYLETMMKFYTTFGGASAEPVDQLGGIDAGGILNLLKNF